MWEGPAEAGPGGAGQRPPRSAARTGVAAGERGRDSEKGRWMRREGVSRKEGRTGGGGRAPRATQALSSADAADGASGSDPASESAWQMTTAAAAIVGSDSSLSGPAV
jgi:hypothetical protein